jgi:hypothetical protein
VIDPQTVMMRTLASPILAAMQQMNAVKEAEAARQQQSAGLAQISRPSDLANMLNASSAQNFLAPPPAKAISVETKAMNRAAAVCIAERSEAILDRISFWMEIRCLLPARPIADHILDRLADRLDRATDEIELRLAA